MAYALDPNQQKDQPQPGAPGVQAVPTSAAPGAGPGGAKTPTGAANSQTPAQPFTNLQSYLTANAPQIQQQADTLSGNLTDQYGKTKGSIDTGVQNFGQAVAGGYAAPNADLVKQAATDPTQFVKDPNNVKAFQSQLNDVYTGPDNFEGTADYQRLNKQVTQDVANAALVNTPAGLQTYLQQTEKNPTQGENLLDSVLLQQSPDAIQKVKAAATPFSQLPDYLSQAVATADQGAAAAPGTAQQAAADANAAITDTVNRFGRSLQDKLTADTTQTNAYNADVNKLISQESNANPYIAALMNALAAYNTSANGYSDTNRFFGATSTLPQINAGNLQSFDNPSTMGPPTLDSAASSGDVAEQMALQQLIGSAYNPMIQNPAQAGTYKAPGTVPTLQSYLSPKLAALGSNIAGAQSAYTANGVLAPNGTPTGDIVGPNIIPVGDVADPKMLLGNLKGATGYTLAPGASGIPIAPGGGPAVYKASDLIPHGVAPAVGVSKPSGLLFSDKNGYTTYDASPLIQGNYEDHSQDLTSLQKAYQTLQSYLSGGG